MALARGARGLLPRAARGLLCQQQQQKATFLSFLGSQKVADAVATVLDGKYMEAKFVHPFLNKNAQFVGEDYNGNKYYEIKEGVLYGKHRWVVYKDVEDYSPASVPPEWHGWLHNINNDAPTRVSKARWALTSFFPPSPLLPCRPFLPASSLTDHLAPFRLPPPHPFCR